MSNDLDEPKDLLEEYECLLNEVIRMRKKYPAICASYLSNALKKDADLMMKADVVATDLLKDAYQAQYLDQTKLEKLNLTAPLEHSPDKVEDFDQQIADIRFALHQIRAARHKNVQE